MTTKLYKYDTKGKIREWYCEISEDKQSWRVCSGLKDGNIRAANWTEVKRAKSQNTIEEQVLFDIQSKIDKKLKEGYSTDPNNIPKIFKCMLAEEFEKKKDKVTFPVIIQPKLNGMRCIITKDGAESRKHEPIHSIPHILQQLKDFFLDNPDAILDGEIYNHDLHDDFTKIMSIARQSKLTSEDIELSKKFLQFHLYDIPSSDKDLVTERLYEYKELVNVPSIRLIKNYECNSFSEIEEIHLQILENNYEGSMIRCRGKYENKRSNLLLKYKPFETEEFLLIDILEGSADWAGHAKKILVEELDGSKRFKAGMRGNKDEALALLKNKDKYIGSQVTIRFTPRSKYGVPQHPVLIDIHDGIRKD